MVDTSHIADIDTLVDHFGPLLNVRIPNTVHLGLALPVVAAEVLALIGGEVFGGDKGHGVLQHGFPGLQTRGKGLDAQIHELFAYADILVKGLGQLDAVVGKKRLVVENALEPGDASQGVHLPVIGEDVVAGVGIKLTQFGQISQIPQLGMLERRGTGLTDDIRAFVGGELRVDDGGIVGVIDELIFDLYVGNSFRQIVQQAGHDILFLPVGIADRRFLAFTGAGGRGDTHRKGEHHDHAQEHRQILFHKCALLTKDYGTMMVLL